MKIDSINPVTYTAKSVPPKIERTDKKASKIKYIGGGTVAIIATSLILYKNLQNPYLKNLAKDLSKDLNKKITPNDLNAVMTKEEFLKIIPTLSEQNYVETRENLRNGTFLADLHSHSKFSDGTIQIQELLEQAAAYGNKLAQINNKKFIFALSDHDGIEGVKEALRIIAQNPDKYKNIKFVPAAELSFLTACQKDSQRYKNFHSDVQMSELLIYDINPFSENTKNFFDNLFQKRRSQLEFSINMANEKLPERNFKKEEYEKFFMKEKDNFFFYNQHWRIFNYLNMKNRISQLAKEQNKNPDVMFDEILTEMKNHRRGLDVYSLDQFIKYNRIETKTIDREPEIDIICKNIFPQKIDENTAFSLYENTFQDIVDYAKKENAILGFAHPGFTMQNFTEDTCYIKMQDMIQQSKGSLKLAEKFHQAYPIGKAISREELNSYNAIIDKLGLINIGGRDNHTKKFI